MLVPIVFIVAFLLALSGALLENAVRAARIAEHDAVARYTDVSLGSGTADFTHGLAQFVERHGTAGPWPLGTVRSALKPVCTTAQLCRFDYFISAQITAASADSTADAAGDIDPAANLQAAVIDEQRVSAQVSATVTDPAGAVLGTRTRYLTYRVFDTAPFAVIAGSQDAATATGAQSNAQGDSGGAAGTATPAESHERGTFDDTRIHVRLTCGTVVANVVPNVNDQQIAGNDGLSWGNTPNAAHETPCTTDETPADTFHSERWINGDANASGWTR